MTEKRLSPAMMSALQAVARMKGGDIGAWPILPDAGERDDRLAPDGEPDPQQGWKPVGR